MKKRILFLLLFFLIGCATPPTDPDALKTYQENNDPLEPYNRVMTDFNFKVNRYVYSPFIKAYRNVLPEFARKRIGYFGYNLSEPYVFVNALLQAEPKAAAHSFGRFFTNSTLGLGGLFDVASDFGIKKVEKNFGQTLYKWGWNGSSAYFVLPFLGPSDMRETVGMTVGWFLDPIDYVLPKKERWRFRIARYAINGIVTMENATDFLTETEKTAIDPYVMLRTMYRQNKQKYLNQGDTQAQSQTYDLDFDLDDEE